MASHCALAYQPLTVFVGRWSVWAGSNRNLVRRNEKQLRSVLWPINSAAQPFSVPQVTRLTMILKLLATFRRFCEFACSSDLWPWPSAFWDKNQGLEWEGCCQDSQYVIIILWSQAVWSEHTSEQLTLDLLMLWFLTVISKSKVGGDVRTKERTRFYIRLDNNSWILIDVVAFSLEFWICDPTLSQWLGLHYT